MKGFLTTLNGRINAKLLIEKQIETYFDFKSVIHNFTQELH